MSSSNKGLSGLRLKEKVRDNELDLSLMGLPEVPMGEIKMFCHRLKNLDLSNNHIRSLGMDFATNLRQLTVLDVSKNLLTSLPENIGLMVHLTQFDLYRNGIKRLPLSMGGMKKLRWLDIKDNPLVPTLTEICGACSNQTECRDSARNVLLFMQQLDKQITAMDEPDELEDIDLDVPSRTNSSKESMSKPSRVISQPIREVFSAPRENGGTDSETDRGSCDEDIPIRTKARVKIMSKVMELETDYSSKTSSRHTSTQFSNHSNMDVIDETIASSVSKTGNQTKKKSQYFLSFTAKHKDQIILLKQEIIQVTKDYYTVCRPALSFLMKMLFQLTCLYILLFTLLGIIYDDNYLRYLLVDCLKLQSVADHVLPFHAIFQRTIQLASSSHYYPVLRMEVETPPDNWVLSGLKNLYNFLISPTP